MDRTPAQERAEQASLAKHAPKLTQYAEIRRRHAAGAAVKHIAAAVGVSRPTVYRYLRLDGPPERKRPHRTRQLLTPYEPYLRQRWEAGCRTKSQLVRDVRAQGYAYSTSTVYRFLLRLERNPAPPGAGSPPPMAVPSPRHVAGLLVQRPERLTDDERTYLARLGEQAPTVATAYALTMEFAALLRARRGDQLEGWLTKVKESECEELRAYARGLEADPAAVQAGLTLAWSNGQTEEQVHRLKLLKRQSCGRAGVDLLRRRVLLAA